ncbi:hypothetical protein MMC26_004333 [Xylographa opegraphella]|nr:hypothetical protein [Xylographa opegraphella]
MAEIQNSNPTIRNASDLPTRWGRTSSPTTKNDPLSFFASSIPSSSYPVDPFEPAPASGADSDDDVVEPIDEQEIYDLISTISDPEHPLSLGSLAVVNLPDIHIKPLARDLQTVLVEITPTITHCSLATVIGLGVRVRLEQSLPPRFRVDVRIKEGTHSTGDQVNKQLGDKERVAAALENAQLMGVLRKMLETCQ